MPVTITNKDRLFAKLQSLVPGVQKAMVAADGQSADAMVTAAKSFAPVKTGKLRDSIRAEPTGQRGAYRVVAGGAATTVEARSGSGAGYDYALGVEYGTRAHVNAGMFRGSRNPGMRRQPFFWPAWRLLRKQMKSRASRALNKAIKDAASK